MKKRKASQIQKASFKLTGLSSAIIIMTILLTACNSKEQELAGTWTLPGHSHYFDLRVDGGYAITGVDGYRETGEWVTKNGLVLLRSRHGIDTLWYSVNGNVVQLEEHKNGSTIDLDRVKEKFEPVQGEEVLEYLLSDTLAYYGPDATIESAPLLFHEDAVLDLESRTEKLWRLKQFKDEWFLGIEALTVIEYSRITDLTKDGIELEYLDRRSYSLRKNYLRKYE